MIFNDLDYNVVMQIVKTASVQCIYCTNALANWLVAGILDLVREVFLRHYSYNIIVIYHNNRGYVIKTN